MNARPDDPVSWIFEEFQLMRRRDMTAKIFREWVERI